jgi:NAD(P)-dependent dehydrogenase (short-subunit alcohol dehydrogenase family)
VEAREVSDNKWLLLSPKQVQTSSYCKYDLYDLCVHDELPSDVELDQRSLENQDTSSQIKQLGREVYIVQCDLSSKEQVGSVVQKIIGTEGEDGMGLVIDILVNCGGIQRRFVRLNWNLRGHFYKTMIQDSR